MKNEKRNARGRGAVGGGESGDWEGSSSPRGARCGENKHAKQSPAGVMLRMFGGRLKDKTGGARTTGWKFAPATKRRVRRCRIKFVAVLGRRTGAWFWLPCARMLQDLNQAWQSVKLSNNTNAHAHLDKGDFIVQGSN